MVFITGEKIDLRNITNDDTPLIIKWRNNQRVSENFIYREKLTVSEHEKWIRTKINTGEVIQFIICEKLKKRPVGTVYLRFYKDDKKEAEYGIFIGEDDAIGKGYGNETATLVCNYAKDTLQLKRLFLRVLTTNNIARKSYEFAGFVYSCEQKIECSDGVTRDIIIMEKVL